MSGINTLLQTLIGTRLPTIMNASFAFVVPVLSIAREVESNDLLNHQVELCSFAGTCTFGSEVDAHPFLIGVRGNLFGA